MGDLICPSGHRVPVDSVDFVGEEQRPQCPVCKALGVATSEAGWTRPRAAASAPPAPAAPQPPSGMTRRSRDALAYLIVGVAAGVVGAALFFSQGPDHTLCSSTYGAAVQAGSARVHLHCTEVGLEYFGGLAGMLAGVALVVLGLVRMNRP